MRKPSSIGATTQNTDWVLDEGVAHWSDRWPRQASFGAIDCTGDGWVGYCAGAKLRLTVTATGGDKSARVFEIRAYNEPPLP